MTDPVPSLPSRVWAFATGDPSRRVLTCAAAAAQVLLPTVYGPRFNGENAPPNVIQPAPYTFTVWFPIFASSIAYAVHQALGPARNLDISRAVGWPLAGAFAATGIWAPLVRSGKFWSAQGALVTIAVLAELGRRRIAHAELKGDLTTAEVAAAAPAAGMLAAWGQAACGVNLAAMLVSNNIVPAGPKAATAGAALLAGLGVLGTRAAAMPERTSVSSRFYIGTLLWAFAGVIIGQRGRSRSAVAVAAGAAATILTVTVCGPTGKRSGRKLEPFSSPT
ncbi:hypothetical protein [Arthrobacter sp. CAN_C5]|uniref:hypothetical protein n=1 Tax=Arthrobacter sp. CAN_C5 TaxID=2760706 RepID=UPI001AE43199|nr:hypothetical protein [Arthrobacter sp. CAN_C5]MBP2215520.1 hypothetical protein [Arthrobacter sp. CAN_C5]